jgi:Protein of unknown function (DUF3435)
MLFCQLAAITGSRPQALLDLRYRRLRLNLICDPDEGRPCLFIFLTPEFTKAFPGKREPWVPPLLFLLLIFCNVLPSMPSSSSTVLIWIAESTKGGFLVRALAD